MPLTKFLSVGLMTGLGAWSGWTIADEWSPIPQFLLANLGFAVGWALGRKFVRSYLD